MPLRWVVCLAFVVAMAGCSAGDSAREVGRAVVDGESADISRKLIDELATHKVVILADNAHGQWQPRQTVIDFLETWLDFTMHDSMQVPRELGLVLEMDSIYLAKAQRYMSAGDPAQILDAALLCSGVFTTADLEFYWRLGDILHRIDLFNVRHQGQTPVRLALISGEPAIDPEHWSFEQRSRYFVDERDSLVSMRIAHFIETHPQYKMIVFYGAAHMQRGLVTKQAGEMSAKGRFLADYLSEAFDGGVVVIGQATPDYWGWYRDNFVLNCDYFLPTAHRNTEIHNILGGPIGYDAVIVHVRAYQSGTPILQIPSMNTAQIAATSLSGLHSTTNDFDRRYWPILLKYLNGVSGTAPHQLDLSNPEALKTESEFWERWAELHRDAAPANVTKMEVWRTLIDSLASSHGPIGTRYDEEITKLLPRAPPLVKRSGKGPSQSERAAELIAYLTADSAAIVMDNLIGLLWVGSAVEKSRAETTLHELTDTSFSDPAQWSDWYRRQNRRM